MNRKLNTGLIGCGSFAKAIHIPNILKNPKYRIVAAADINLETAKQAADETGADYHTADADEILYDNNIDVVFITTRHDSHAELSVRAARAGKHILCEKPMGLNEKECREVSDAVKESGIKYTVGYNRGLAPMAVRARELLAGTRDRILAYHRMQNLLPVSHWLLDNDVGGGRITGEGCHIFDMLCEIIQSPPARVYAQGGSFLEGSTDPRDSAEIMITFSDGSVGTALLMSAGSGMLPKEATEIYSGGKAVYINDFREMEYCGFEGRDRVKMVFEPQDKGHAGEIDLLADAILKRTDAPNGPENALRAALIGFKAAESIDTGMPVEIKQEEYRRQL